MKKIINALKKYYYSLFIRGPIKTVRIIFEEIFPKKATNFKVYVENLGGKKALEIGGPSRVFGDNNILPIYQILQSVDGCNFSTNTVWEGQIQEGQHYKYHAHRDYGYQYICDAVELSPVPSRTYEVVISSHALEHIANPLKALHDWLRTLKDGGIFLLVVPQKDSTFDHQRPLTTLEHVIDDFNRGIKEDDLTHLDEILQCHDLRLDPSAGDYENFKKRCSDNFNTRCLHHHTFSTFLVKDILNYLGLEILTLNESYFHIWCMTRKRVVTQLAC